ncbi:MAG: division plane positioning ATPase MipZ [Sphingomonadaceae bacterium]
MTGQAPKFLVFANEKGGTGKSTAAVHVAVALAAQGRRVAAIDLDGRQRTFSRYMMNRAATRERTRKKLPMPRFETFNPHGEGIDARLDALAAEAETVIVDTPGREDGDAARALARADILVTPINDSFVDLDLIGEVDPESYAVRRPSFYAELVWQSRTRRAKESGGRIDWVVLRNRLQQLEARNMRRVETALAELAQRAGFRVIPGLSERVVYRELFPQGLTLVDIARSAQLNLSQIAARQELREMIAALGLPQRAPAPQPARAAALS